MTKNEEEFMDAITKSFATLERERLSKRVREAIRRRKEDAKKNSKRRTHYKK